MNNTEWRRIPDFSKYEVGSNGEIRSYNKGPCRYLKGGVDKDGYRRAVLIRDDGTRRSLHFARLVAENFIGQRPRDRVLCHKNGKKADNRVENLEYKTQHENILDKARHGTQLMGEAHQNAKLREVEAREIFGSSLSHLELASKFEVHTSTIYGIKTKRTWKHIHK